MGYFLIFSINYPHSYILTVQNNDVTILYQHFFQTNFLNICQLEITSNKYYVYPKTTYFELSLLLFWNIILHVELEYQN